MLNRSRKIASALRIAKRYADGGGIRDVLFDPTPMSRKTPRQRVMEGHQEFEPGYIRGWDWNDGPDYPVGIKNMRGQDLQLRRAADGGAQRTAPFPEKPEGYEFFGPEDNPVDTAPVANTEGVPSYDPAQEPPRRGPPAVMEPDLSAMQTGQYDVPEGYAVNDAGEVFDKQTGQVIQQTPRMNISPWTKTPQGDIELNVPKMLDIFGNLGGGWSAPVQGAEAVLGVGARLPRRVRGQPMTLDRVLNELTPEQIQRLSRNQLNALRADASAFWDELSKVHENPEKYAAENFPNWGVLEDRLSWPDVTPRQQRTPIQAIGEQTATTPAERGFFQDQQSIDSIAGTLTRLHGNDEAAIVRWFDTAEQNGVQPLILNQIFDRLPPELRQRVKIHDAYSHELITPRKPEPDPTQFEEPITQQEFEQIPYKPPTEAPPQRDYGSWDELEAALRRQQLTPEERSRLETGHPFQTPAEAKSWLRDNGHNPDDWGYSNPQDYVELANDISGRAPLTSTPHPLSRSAANLREPIRGGSRINLSDFFSHFNTRAIQRLSDRQLEDLATQLNDHEAISSGLYSNLENYQPGMLSALRGRIRERREATGTPDPETQAARQALIDRLERGEPPQRRPRTQQPPREPPPSADERMRQALARFNTAFQEHLGSHFRDTNQFFNDYFAGRHTPDMQTSFTPYDGFRFEGTLKNEEGQIIGSISRDFDPARKTAHHGYLRIQEGARGTGFIPRMLSNQISTYRSLGIERVMLNANIDVGSYAWAKYGWIPSIEDWSYLANRIKHNLNTYYSDTPWVRNNYLLEILNNPNPKSIWLLADIETPVSSTNQIPIGKSLLMNRSWNGTLHLTDEESLARFNDYVASRIKKAEKKGKEK